MTQHSTGSRRVYRLGRTNHRPSDVSTGPVSGGWVYSLEKVTRLLCGRSGASDPISGPGTGGQSGEIDLMSRNGGGTVDAEPAADTNYGATAQRETPVAAQCL